MPANIRAIRKRLGLTQAELAAELGVSRKCIVQREAGKVPITRETELAMESIIARSANRALAERP